MKKISSTETTIFVYDGGGQLVAEYSTNIVPQAEAKISYLTQDHLGSPRVLTDATGAIIARKDFAAFGDETMTAQRTSTLGYKPENIRQDYTGYQKDDESGLEFAQARYYNSSHGRFTSVDPLTASANVKDPQTFNRYSYAMNSPYKFTDPLGLISETTGACGSRCANSSGRDVDGSAFRGTDTSLKGVFEAMDLSRQVEKALARLESGDWVPEIGLTDAGGERSAIGKALHNMSKNGDATAQKIASDIILSNITIGVTNSETAFTTVASASSLNSVFSRGDEISYGEALGYLVIYIPQGEFTNSVSPEAAIESTLVHEGTRTIMGKCYNVYFKRSELQ